MSGVDDIHGKLSHMTSFIKEARENVLRGQQVNLSGMDGEVAALCERVVGLPPDEARQVQPIMAEMISELEALGAALEGFKDQMNSTHAAGEV